jgi:hypothetical protein
MHLVPLFFFVRYLHFFLQPEKIQLFLSKFLLAILVGTLMRNSCPLRSLNPEHTLKVLGLKMGDLFLTRRNIHDRPPVIGFLEDLERSKDFLSMHRGTSYFLPIAEGTVGIYFRKNINSLQSNYWCRFHEVWIEGKRCVIHEQFIDPIVKGAKKDE